MKHIINQYSAAVLGIMLVFTACSDTSLEDSEAPFIEIISPFDSSMVHGRIELKCTGSDNIGISAVNYYINDSLLNTQLLTKSPWTWYLNTTGLTDSAFHRILAVAEDNAGNVSLPSKADIYVKNSGYGPLLPLYFRVVSYGKHYVTLEWEPSQDLRFMQYEIYRSFRDTSDFPDAPITVITDAKTGSFTDRGLDESSLGLIDSSYYYYRMTTVNRDSLSSTGQTLNVQTRYPTRMQWSSGGIAGTTKSTVTLQWTALGSEDMADLDRLLISRTPSGGESVGLTVLKPDYRNPWTDTGLDAATSYTYRIRQLDSLGYYSDWSNSVTAATAEFSPELEIISSIGKNSVRFSFDPYPYDDLLDYKVYFSRSEIDTADLPLPVFIRHDADSSEFQIGGLIMNTRYFVKIRISDSGGNISDTDWSFSTGSIPTPKIRPTDSGLYFISMEYTAYEPVNNDFLETRIYRLPTFTSTVESLTPVFSSTDPGNTTFTEDALMPCTNYIYAVAHEDTAGNTEISAPARILTQSLKGVEITHVYRFADRHEIQYDWSEDGPEENLDHFEIFRCERTAESEELWSDEYSAGTSDDLVFETGDFSNDREYSYRVDLVDSYGNRIGSRKHGSYECGPAPAPTLIINGTSLESVSLGWYFSDGMESLKDFYRYHLYTSNSGVFPAHPDSAAAGTLEKLISISNKRVTNYTMFGMTDRTIRYYCVYFEDICGNMKGSNVVSAFPVP